MRSRYEPPQVNSLEGLTWPDTYRIGVNETETEILQKIVNQFDTEADALAAGGSYPAVIIASLIEAEAGSKEDTPLISAVISNRLKEGIPLQIDATLCYAKGGCPPVPTDADRKIDSPFNTYKIGGLPPTPIKTISAVALRAALTPAPVAYKYYVSDDKGKTYYAVTLSEHEKNVAKAREWRLRSARASRARSSGPPSCTARRPERAVTSPTSPTCSTSPRSSSTRAAPSRKRSPRSCTIKCNGGAQRFPQPGWQSGGECKCTRKLDCETDMSSRDESRK